MTEILVVLGIVLGAITGAFFIGRDSGKKSIQIKDDQDAVKEQATYAQAVDGDTAHFDHIMERLRNDPPSEVQEVQTPAGS